jgi:hypothetical protein
MQQQWISNDSFSGQPDARRSEAWMSLHGRHNGFFIHKGLVPEPPHMTVFSAHHQVHCLEHIWRGIWALRTLAENGTLPPKLLPGEPRRHDPLDAVHVDHCLEYLRYAVMCRPDLTAEVVSDTGSVTGNVTMHTCQSWTDMVEWTSQYQPAEYMAPWDKSHTPGI